MKKIICFFILIMMLLSAVPAAGADGGIWHNTVVGAATITIRGVANGAAGLPLTLKVNDGNTLVYVDQMIIDDEEGFAFTFSILSEGAYTYTLRHPRMSSVANGTFYIASASDKTNVLNAFRNLNVGPGVADRIRIMREFLTTPLHVQVLNLNLNALNSLKNPSAVLEGMCDAFNQLTTLESILAKFEELILKQAAAEEKSEQQQKLIQNIKSAALGDMLDIIEQNSKQLGVKTKYGFAIIKEAYKNGDTALAANLKKALQGVATPQEFNRAFVSFVALIAYEKATWGQFDAIEDYYRDELGGIFDEARKVLTDLELTTLKQAMQDIPSFADIDAIKAYVKTKTSELVNARPDGKKHGGGSGGAKTVKYNETPNVSQNTTTQAAFTDCEHVPWAKESIFRLKEKGIVCGKNETSFYPDDKVTREEFLKMLLLAFNIAPASDGVTNFADIAADSWCAPYVAKAFELGIVSGVSETMFGAGQQITRQDMAVLCYRMLTKLNKKLSTNGTQKFSDAEKIADYALEAVDAMQSTGVIKGMGDNRFEPLLFATRAEAAVIIDRIMNLK